MFINLEIVRILGKLWKVIIWNVEIVEIQGKWEKLTIWNVKILQIYNQKPSNGVPKSKNYVEITENANPEVIQKPWGKTQNFWSEF